MNDPMKTHGAFSWNELITSDVSAAKAFYSELLGWTMEDIVSEGTPYTMVKVADQEMGGIMAVPAEAAGMPPMWGSYVTVDDINLCVKRTQELGGKVIMPPKEIPCTGHICVIQDPQGATLNLIQYQSEKV